MNSLYRDYDDDRSCSDDDDDNNDIRRLYGDELSSTTRMTSECNSSSSSLNYDPEKSPQSPHSHAKPRRSLRDHLVHAMSSPARVARNSLTSPGSGSGASKRRSSTSSSSNNNNNNNKSASHRIKTSSQRLRKDQKSWRAEFDMPAGISREEAVAILICRELEMMDL